MKIMLKKKRRKKYIIIKMIKKYVRKYDIQNPITMVLDREDSRGLA